MIGSRVALVLFAGQGTVRYRRPTDRGSSESARHLGALRAADPDRRCAAGLESAFGRVPADLDPFVSARSCSCPTARTNSECRRQRAQAARIFAVGIGTTSGGQVPLYDRTTGKFTGYLRAPPVPVPRVSSRRRCDRSRRRAVGATSLRGQRSGDRRSRARLRKMESSSRSTTRVRSRRALRTVHRARGGAAAARVAHPESATDARSARNHGKTFARRGRRILGSRSARPSLGDRLRRRAMSNEAANGMFAAGDYAGALAAYRDLQIDLPARLSSR